MLQKNKAFALGLLLVSGVIQTSFASDKKVQKSVAPKLAKKLNVRYNISCVKVCEKIEEGANELKNSPEFMVLSPGEKSAVQGTISNYYDPTKKQPKLLVLTKKLHKDFGIKSDALKKIDEGVTELRNTSAYKKLNIDQKSDVHASVYGATSCKEFRGPIRKMNTDLNPDKSSK